MLAVTQLGTLRRRTNTAPLLPQVDEMLKVREALNAAHKDSGVKLSVNDFVVKAAALALKKVGGG